MLKKRRSSINLLDLIPERTRGWVTSEEGRVKILVPKYGESAAGTWLAKRMQKPYMYVKLDAVGSAVWNACDGESTVAEIASRLQKQFGDQIDPIYARLGQFFNELERSKFIKWKNLASLMQNACCSENKIAKEFCK